MLLEVSPPSIFLLLTLMHTGTSFISLLSVLLCSPVILENYLQHRLHTQSGDHVCHSAASPVLHGGHEQCPGGAQWWRPQQRYLALHFVLSMFLFVFVRQNRMTSAQAFGFMNLLGFNWIFQWREWKWVRLYSTIVSIDFWSIRLSSWL